VIRRTLPRFALAGLLFGCSGEQTQIGTGEPFRVHAPAKVTWTAQFVKGELPGSPPEPEKKQPPTNPTVDAGQKVDGGARPDTRPLVTSLSTPAAAIQGQGDLPVSGIVSINTASVGLALAGVGSGYWVVPVGAPDPSGGLEWHALCDFDRTIPSAFHKIRAVAFDESGNAGPQLEKEICVVSAVPDNFNSCDKSTPPEAVISLAWDANVDLDLQVRTPEGRFVGAKNPTTLPASDAGIVPPGSGVLDRDSNAGCVTDAIRRENLVWPKGFKPQGRYAIYANLFDVCKQASVRFTVTAYFSKTGEDGGNRHLVKGFERSGELLDFQANGGVGRGLFVGEVIFH
jgi:hypothetical protein